MVASAGLLAFLTTILPALAFPAVCPSCTQSNVTTCTTAVNVFPANDLDCTFYSQTATATASVDCGGCALTTNYLGLGLGCQTATTLTGVATTTVTECAKSPVRPSPLGAPSPKPVKAHSVSISTTRSSNMTTAAPTPTCTIDKLGTFAPLRQSTCTSYGEYVTTTVSKDCGGHPGCAVATLGMGHGPPVHCGARISIPTGTVTATYCTA